MARLLAGLACGPTCCRSALSERIRLRFVSHIPAVVFMIQYPASAAPRSVPASCGFTLESLAAAAAALGLDDDEKRYRSQARQAGLREATSS